MVRHLQEELALIEANTKMDPDMKRAMFKYPIIQDLSELVCNVQQAITISQNLETKLRRKSELKAYNIKL
jgi:hypothetical protein